MSAPQEPTQKELTLELRGEMREGFAEIKGEIKALTQAVQAGNAARAAETADLRKDVDDHESRIRSLEGRKTIAPMTLWTTALGALMAIAAIAGLVVNALK